VSEPPARQCGTTLVDSNVLLDVITGDPHWGRWSGQRLAEVLEQGRVVINPIVYAEVSARYETIERLDEAVSEEDFVRMPVPFLAAFLAEKACLEYRSRGGRKTASLSDFFIGAHAAVSKLRLLTRDPRRYRTYFPTVQLIAPEQAP
jgi:predicted nucleic acid-binding protein